MSEVILSLEAVIERLKFHKKRVVELSLGKNLNLEQLEMHRYQVRRFQRARLVAATSGQVDISKFHGNVK